MYDVIYFAGINYCCTGITETPKNNNMVFGDDRSVLLMFYHFQILLLLSIIKVSIFFYICYLWGKKAFTCCEHYLHLACLFVVILGAWFKKKKKKRKSKDVDHCARFTVQHKTTIKLHLTIKLQNIYGKALKFNLKSIATVCNIAIFPHFANSKRLPEDRYPIRMLLSQNLKAPLNAE